MPTERPEKRLTPRLGHNALLLVGAVAGSTLLIGRLLAPEAELDLSSVIWSLLLASPTAHLLLKGHFGWSHWRLPTPAAFIYVLWIIGLAPSVVTIPDWAQRLYRFGPDAVWWGRIAVLFWFWAFALTLGRADDQRPKHTAAVMQQLWRRPMTLAGFACIVLVWLASGLVAQRLNMLSQWSSASSPPRVGSWDMEAVLVYKTLTKLMPPLGLSLAIAGPPRWRLVGWLVLLAGTVALFVYSERRSWIVVSYLCLFLMVLVRGGVSGRALVSVGLLAWLGLGPAVWVFRTLLRDERASATEMESVVRALTDYTERSDTRQFAGDAAVENINQRLGLAAALFGATEEVLDGRRASVPTFLSAPARLVPSAIWPKKNEVADRMGVWSQLSGTRRFPRIDVAVAPITEFVFNLGLAGAALGGAVYGLLGRLLDRMALRSLGRLSALMLWLAFLVCTSYVDAGTLEPFLVFREVFVLSGLVLALESLGRSVHTDQARRARL